MKKFSLTLALAIVLAAAPLCAASPSHAQTEVQRVEVSLWSIVLDFLGLTQTVGEEAEWGPSIAPGGANEEVIEDEAEWGPTIAPEG